MDAIGNKKKKLGESEIYNLWKRNPINYRTNNPLPTIPKKTPRITPKRISLQIREALRVTPRRKTLISPINSAKTESSHKPNVHADSIIISAYFVEVLDTLPKNVLNPLLQQRKLRLTVHPSLKTQKKLKQCFWTPHGQRAVLNPTVQQKSFASMCLLLFNLTLYFYPLRLRLL